MFEWFNQKSNKVGFDDMQKAIRSQDKYLIINTLQMGEQDCLIRHTISINQEEKMINDLISNYAHHTKIIILYGKNATDASPEKKYKQFQSLGFSHIYIYAGGLFEWMLLQDIYGDDEFPTTTKVLDILKYSGNQGYTQG
jgi:hypothetical protein